MPKSFPVLTAAAAALALALSAAAPAQAAPMLAWASPMLVPAGLSMASPVTAEPAPKSDLTRVFLAAGAAWRDADGATDAVFAAASIELGAAFAATPMAAPELLALAQEDLAVIEEAPAEAPAPLSPVFAGLRETANRPDDLILTDAGEALEVVSLDELETYAGGTGIDLGVFTNPVLTGIASGNTVSGVDVTSGAITIETDAFSGYDGIGNFVINSGHNNVLQSTVNVSIVMTPP